jgi:multiple sugar transport system ATP-binding protein
MRIVLERLRKTFLTLRGKVDALSDVDLKIQDGEFFILLGPSGCGKSTLLNLVAGLEKPSQGVIRFGDQTVADPAGRIMVSPRNRDVAMVFQSYALYPHMDVFENIAFPLKVSKIAKNRIKESVGKAADLLGIENLLHRKPGELSGGQRQRVAIARALVRDPKVFLLDEPLSNLDAQLRTSTRAGLKRLQRELGITTLYVTHDQTEAMTLGDRIALLNHGRLVQVGAPKDMYAHPESPFAATFIGAPPMNLIPVEIYEEKKEIRLAFAGISIPLPDKTPRSLTHVPGKKALMGIRPEHIRMGSEKQESGLPGRIRTVEPLGREVIYHLESGGGRLVVLGKEERYAVDSTVNLSFPPDRIHLFDPETESHKRAPAGSFP